VSRSADRLPTVTLEAGRERSLRQRHPWIYSGAIARAEPGLASGDIVEVRSAGGEFLARAAYSPASRIRARVWTFDSAEPIDAAFFARRVARAVAARSPLLGREHSGCRLVYGESDGLPGVVADRYDDTVVVQLLSAGAERWRDAIVAALVAAVKPACVYERSDAEVRGLEGLAPSSGVRYGTLPEAVTFVEGGIRYRVDVVGGQKTGFFLDQRDNRAAVRARAAGGDVLDLFCHSGGFALSALAGGAAHVVAVDSSAGALALARENLARNDFGAERVEWREADVFSELRRLRDARAQFDLVVLDPPKFAPTAAHAERAARAYKDVNLLGLKLLREGGLLATFSCSGGVDAALFRKIVAGAAVDAGTDATIVARLAASVDHPVTLAFPESEYLKGLLLRKNA
jgi:23S rRNA (cytosine1962-C5)-methyltransferase